MRATLLLAVVGFFNMQVERTGCLFIARSDDLAFLVVVRSTALPFESWYPDESKLDKRLMKISRLLFYIV